MGWSSKSAVLDLIAKLVDGGGSAGARGARNTASLSKRDGKKAWLCRCKDCPAAAAGRANFGHRDSCFGCERPKGRALNPLSGNVLSTEHVQPQGKNQQPPAGSPPSKRALKRARAASSKVA